ncbi:hypothetical protein Btru_039623 [Bulinus truncatus]|nr:hypothetical protein Btru_039623 [Bulinus truncatus]
MSRTDSSPVTRTKGWVDYSTDELNLKMNLTNSIFDFLISGTVQTGTRRCGVGVPYIIVDVERHGLDAGAFERVKRTGRERQGDLLCLMWSTTWEHPGL